MRFAFDGCTLDADARQLSGPQGEIRLSPKSFELLLLLADRWPAAVSKADLHKTIWPDTFVSDDSLARLVTEVRAALGDNAREPRYIRTVHGFGYAMAASVQRDDDPRHGRPADGRPDRVEQPSAPAARAFGWRGAAALLIGASALALAASAWTGRPAPTSAPEIDRHPIVFSVAAPDGRPLSQSASVVAVAPDGLRLVFLAHAANGARRLWIRELDAATAFELEGTEGALGPFWSPDSRQVAFFSEGRLRRVGATGGPVVTICEVDGAPPGGSWRADGTILFGGGAKGILRVTAEGGAAVPVTAVDPRRERGHVLPMFLPDGRHFLYLSQRLERDGADIYVSSLEGGPGRRLLTASSQAQYVEPGHLLFLRDDTLFAQPFDPVLAQVSGSAGPLPYRIGRNPITPRGMFSASNTGVLAFRAAAATQFVWFDRQGGILARSRIEAGDSDPALARSGRVLAVTRTHPAAPGRAVWAVDEATGASRRIVSASTWSVAPVWSPDGQRLAYAARTPEGMRILAKAVDEASEELALVESSEGVPTDWSADGRFLLFQTGGDSPSGVSEVWWADLSRERTRARLSPQGTDARDGQFSPDGRWVAYASSDSGRFEVYVVTFPDAKRRIQVSTEGGVEPRWRGDGRELFYLAPDQTLMAVPIPSTSPLRAGTPMPLFWTGADASGRIGIVGRNQYVVSADGSRFLVRQPAGEGAGPPLTIVVNWDAARSN